jgi:small subunit ribosomal protein S9
VTDEEREQPNEETTPASEAPSAPDEGREPDPVGASASDAEAVPPSEPPAAAEAPAEPEPAAEAPAEPEPAAEAPAEPEPEAEAPAEPEPEAEAPPEPASPDAEAIDSEAATPEPEAEAAAAESPQPASAAAETTDAEAEGIEVAPRERPEIPGADLVPDIIPEGDEFLDAEERAAAEAEAEAAAARAREDSEDEVRPIADAAIDLAAGARYTATGKRKTAVARVILKPGSGTYEINGKPLDDFFPRETLQRMIRHPLETVGYESRMDVVARMHGGGVSSQAGALRHGISRALIVADPNLRGELKRRGFLTRDPRVKERKKAGLKKARKRPQFSKR